MKCQCGYSALSRQDLIDHINILKDAEPGKHGTNNGQK